MKKLQLRFVVFLILTLTINTVTYADDRSALIIGQAEGVLVHDLAIVVLTEAYKNAGIDVQFKPSPSKRSLMLANDGIYDGETARIESITEKYTNLVRVPTPVLKAKSFAYGINPTLSVNQWSDLQGLRIGIKHGIRYADIHTRGMQQEFFHSYDKAFEMLLLDRIDVVICTEIQGKAAIHNAFANQGIHPLGEPVYQAPVYHFLNEKHKALIPIIDQQLKILHDSDHSEHLMQQALDKILSQ